MSLLKAAFVGDPHMLGHVYRADRRERLAARVDLLPTVITSDDALSAPERLADIDLIFSTWGVPYLLDKHLDKMFNLKAVFYAAGSVKGFASPLLARGIVVVSAWRANAVSVAEYTLAQILLANKGYFRNRAEHDGSLETYKSAFRGAGSYGETVALLGAGAIGSKLIDLLKPFKLNVIVFDPFMSEERAAELGVEKVETLSEAFDRGYIVSNHLANNPQTVHLIDRSVLERLRNNATFINTGRGATVDEAALIDIFTRRTDLTALLDVTDPEPPGADSPLANLPNVHLTTHIAGALNDEVQRMADLVIDDLDRYIAGLPLENAVTLANFERLA